MPHRSAKHGRFRIKLLIALAVGLCLVLFASMFFSHYFLHPRFSFYGVILDVLFLGCVLYPVLYLLIVRPYFFIAKFRDEMTMARDRFVNIFQLVGDPMFILGTDATIQMVNIAACKLSGFSEDELVGQPVVLLLSSDDNVDPHKLVDEIFDKGQLNDFKLKLLSKNGDEISVVFSANAFSEALEFPIAEHRRFVGIICIAHDVRKTTSFIAELEESKRELEVRASELVRSQKALLNMMDDLQVTKENLECANKELQKIDQLKTDFVSTVSHELCTPMSIVRESIAQVLEGLHGATTPQQREFLEISFKNVTRLGHMVDDLLDISKIEEGKVELDLRPVDFTGIVRDVAAGQRHLAAAKGLQITDNMPPHAVEICIDRDRIIQVLTNLIANAVKFTEKGTITVVVTDSTDHVECSVSDTGIGIDQVDISKVFDKFQQFVRMPGPGERGSGLGLAIANSIIEMHKGKIWVSSQPGLGSRFTFVLPKNRGESLFDDYLNQGLVHAKAKKQDLSVLVAAINGVDADSNERRGAVNVMEALKKIFLNDVSRLGGRIFRDTERLIVVLENCPKNDAVKIMMKIQSDVKKQLEAFFLADKVTIRYGLITFPDDVDNHKEMFERVKRV